jgi:deoxyribodipyrimidine photolyase
MDETSTPRFAPTFSPTLAAARARIAARELPADIREATTGVPVVDMAVRTLYATGMLHNHARMWLASYVVHVRKVHWRCGADWLYGHLLDGDLASNHLGWQWVAGTGSSPSTSCPHGERSCKRGRQGSVGADCGQCQLSGRGGGAAAVGATSSRKI